MSANANKPLALDTRSRALPWAVGLPVVASAIFALPLYAPVWMVETAAAGLALAVASVAWRFGQTMQKRQIQAELDFGMLARRDTGSEQPGLAAWVLNMTAGLIGKIAKVTTATGEVIDGNSIALARTSNKMGTAVRSIGDMLQRSESVARATRAIREASSLMENDAEVAAEIVKAAKEQSEQSRGSIDKTVAALNETRDLSHMEELTATAVSTRDLMNDVSTEVINLSEIGKQLHEHLAEINADSEHARIFRLARTGAFQIQAALEGAIVSGKLTEAAVFDTAYRQISGTNPPKFKTHYDDFTDQTFPDIQEPKRGEVNRDGCLGHGFVETPISALDL